MELLNRNKLSASVKSSGFSLLEAVIGIAIISGSLLGLVSVSQKSVQVMSKKTDKLLGTFLAEESLEVARLWRDADWTILSSATRSAAYYPVFSATTSTWALSATDPGPIDGLFTRTLSVDDVYRKVSDDDIVDVSDPSQKALDAKTLKITSKVTWRDSVISEPAVSFDGGTTAQDLANFPSNDAGDGDAAQSFTTTPSGTLQVGGIELYIERAPSTTPSDIYVELRTDSTIGTVLASSSPVVSSGLSDRVLSWVPFVFPNTITLNPSTTYYIRLRSIPDSTLPFSGSSGTLYWGYGQTGSSPYSGGDAYRYVARFGNESDSGQVLTQYDFSFRVVKTATSTNKIELTTYLTDIF